MQGERPHFSRSPGIFVTSAKPNAESGQNTGTDFQKIYPYYTISNRQNQLFFATFSSQIANSSLCTKPSRFSRSILFKSDNLIFPDGFPPVLSSKNPGFPFFRPLAPNGQLYRPAVSPFLNRPFSPPGFRCVCNRPSFILHFAACPGTILHLSRHLQRFSVPLSGFSEPQAGSPSVPPRFLHLRLQNAPI